jgi:HlyD family secretion protein
MKLTLLQTLSVAGATFIFTILSGCKSRSGSLTFETSPAFRGDMVEHVTASGSLGAVTSVEVGSQVSGKISGLYADFNSMVKKGPARSGD